MIGSLVHHSKGLIRPSIKSLSYRSGNAVSLLTSRRISARLLSTENGEKSPVTVDREFPDPFKKKKQNRYYLAAYAIGVTLACGFIFNYEKTGSPVINSVFYCLRRSEQVKKVLGNDISYAQQWPWIWGELNTVQGNVDIQFRVKGDTRDGILKLKANRNSKMDPFHIHLWTIEFTENGEKKVLDLTKDSSIQFGL